ncbi:MAG: ABC transporter ATP-binding protein/permease [Lachnospiraceae bacterium]|nr:ABC transporter ATP-binding protein/permease [Lachnospiraceae bacterium]
MRKLLRYMKGYRKKALLAPLFKLLEASMELCVPLIVKAIIDRGIGQEDRPFLIKMTLLMVLFGLLGYGFALCAQYFAAKVATEFTGRVRYALFDHIQSLSYSDLDRLGTATLITRMTSDTVQIQNGVNLTLRLLLRSPFIVFGALIMAFLVDPKAAVVFAVIIPILCVVVFGIMLITIPLYRRVQNRLDAVLSKTREHLAGIRVLRAFCKEEAERQDFKERHKELTREQLLVGRISALMNPLTYVLINLALLVLIYVGALRVDLGIITQGAVIALTNYMSQILVELIKMANLIITLTKSIAGGNRVQSVFEVTNTMADGTKTEGIAGAPAVEFRNVSFSYHGSSAESLSNISFTLMPGESLGVIGGTGSGKSTLVQLISRYYDVTDGEVLVDGVPVKEWSLKSLRRRIGDVPQKAVLFSGTVRSNLQWGSLDATTEDMMAALKAAQAEAFVSEKPEGLDAPVSAGGTNFSGGQRQRLTVARALVGSPEILVLDDSASALDYGTDAAMRKALSALPQKPARIIVSQRTVSLADCNRILVLDDGNAAGYGTHDELLKSCKEYEEIYRSQASGSEGGAA